MADNVYHLDSYRDEWREVFSHDDGHTQLHVYANERQGEVEVFQIADGKSNRSVLPTDMVDGLLEALGSLRTKKKGNK